MSDPTSYDPEYSFAGFQANSPTTPLPGVNVDNELADISTSTASLVAAIKDVRRSDGALKNNIVTYDSLALALQLIFDPTDGAAVAAAVATAQAAATAASGSATAAGTSATNAANSAAAAAASASGVNLALYLSKAGNLANLGNTDTALANLTAMKLDGTNATGRLAQNGAWDVGDYNNQIASGIYSSAPGAANAPDSANYWVVQVITADTGQLWVTQIAYQFVGAQTSADSVLVYKRFSANISGVRTWTPWISNSAVPVGAVMNFAAAAAPPGYLKLNGALVSRTTYAALWAHATVGANNNLVSEATWSGGASGSFSTGDLSTTFRLPDMRGEFMRWYDDSRGIDSGRVIGVRQADLLRDHTHGATQPTGSYNSPGGATNVSGVPSFSNTSGVNSGLGGTETRPRNIPLLACIKY
jgi:hypothetical protein